MKLKLLKERFRIHLDLLAIELLSKVFISIVQTIILILILVVAMDRRIQDKYWIKRRLIVRWKSNMKSK